MFKFIKNIFRGNPEPKPTTSTYRAADPRVDRVAAPKAEKRPDVFNDFFDKIGDGDD